MPSKTLGASILSLNVSRSFLSLVWKSRLNLMQSVHKLPGMAFFCCFSKTLMSCSGSSSVTYGQKNWSPVQVAMIPCGPTNSQEWCSYIPLLSFLFSLFFKKLLCVSLYITYGSLFTVQSVKMSNKNKYQCYSS